jgi:hypothetical protein
MKAPPIHGRGRQFGVAPLENRVALKSVFGTAHFAKMKIQPNNDTNLTTEHSAALGNLPGIHAPTREKITFAEMRTSGVHGLLTIARTMLLALLPHRSSVESIPDRER